MSAGQGVVWPTRQNRRSMPHSHERQVIEALSRGCMPTMGKLAMFRFFVTPICLGLALFNLREPMAICAIPAPLSFLGSMWFMYLVMAVIHAEPWLDRLRRGASAPRPPSA